MAPPFLYAHIFVMAGLDPAIHATQARPLPVPVDARQKAGHDEYWMIGFARILL
jgi:hypothetical protein